MPRWRALPDELDPQVREFAEQLRRLVDRSGLGIAALADRTGYSKTSWERYLNGRLLAPKGAVVALAEVTGTSPVPLTTLWELAERAWSRSELRYDMTMEAIRISTERAASAGPGTSPSPGNGSNGSSASRESGTKAVRPPGAARGGNGTAAVPTPGFAGPAGAPPTVPPAGRADLSGPSGSADVSAPSTTPGGDGGVNSWGVAGYRGPAPSGGRASESTAAIVSGAESPGPPVPDAEAPSGPSGGPPRARAPRPAGAAGGSGGLGGPAARRRLVMFLAGMVGVLVVVAVALFITRDDGEKGEAAGSGTKPSAAATQKLPPGVKCAGAGCTGKDAEAMGCAKDTTTVTTVKSATVGTTLVEVRYSTVCGAAWGRITLAAQGDKVTLTAGTQKVSDVVTAGGDTIAYTSMVAVPNGSGTKACAILAAGLRGCTP
jgi:hypothetical protein